MMMIAATYGSRILTSLFLDVDRHVCLSADDAGERVTSIYHGNPAITGLFVKDWWDAVLAEIPLVFGVGAILMRYMTR